MPSGFFGHAVILGIGVAFESNSPESLAAALESVPGCNGERKTLSEPSVYVVLTADQDTHTPTKEHRTCEKQLHIADGGIRVVADGERGRASCSFRIDVMGSELFREMVNTAALFLVTHQGRIPIHASAFVIGDRAILLAGRSGSGKSTLALAASRLRLPMLAEDTVFVQLEPVFRVWGLADRIHVFERDAPLRTEAQIRLRSGRVKRALPIEDTQRFADRALLCVIAPGDRVNLDPLSIDDAMRTLTQNLEPGFDLFADRLDDAIRAVAFGGCWQLTLSLDPDAAIATLVTTFGAKTSDQSG